MAESGSFNTNSYNNYYLQFSWSIKSQSTSGNYSVISWSITAKRSSGSGGYYLDYDAYIGDTKISSISSSNRQMFSPNTVIDSGETYVYHDNTGNKTLTASISAAIYSYTRNCTGSGSWALKTIPRYPSISQSIASETETSLTVSWQSDSLCDFYWYSLDGGSTWVDGGTIEAYSGTYAITGLEVGTEYRLVTSVQRKDSHLYKNSSVLNVSTYSYPHGGTMPDFIIGSNLTIGLYNPMNHSVMVQLLANDGTVAGSVITDTQSASGFNSQAAINALYNSIPNALSGTYSVRVIYASLNTDTRTGGLYQADSTDAAPVIGSASYADVNSYSTAITQNDQLIVQNASTVRFTASQISARYGASLVSCVVEVNNAALALVMSGNTATGGDASIDSGSNVTAVFKLTDSRGLVTSKSVEVTMLQYVAPTLIATAARHNNFYSETDLNADADYASIDGKNTITITYRAQAIPIAGQVTPADVTGTLQDGTTSVAVLNNNFGWQIFITATDAFNVSATYALVIGRGIPIFYIDRLKSSLGVNMFPANDNSVEVDGDIYAGDIYAANATLTGNLNLSNPLPVTSGGTGQNSIADFLASIATEYTQNTEGNLTALTTETRTFTVTGSGLVFLSASFSSDGGTWGYQRVDIQKGNAYLAVATDNFTAATGGWFGANADVFVKVNNGDVLTVTGRSNRYQSGNKWYFYTNALAFGCTLTVS